MDNEMEIGKKVQELGVMSKGKLHQSWYRVVNGNRVGLVIYWNMTTTLLLFIQLFQISESRGNDKGELNRSS